MYYPADICDSTVRAFRHNWMMIVGTIVMLAVHSQAWGTEDCGSRVYNDSNYSIVCDQCIYPSIDYDGAPPGATMTYIEGGDMGVYVKIYHPDPNDLSVYLESWEDEPSVELPLQQESGDWGYFWADNDIWDFYGYPANARWWIKVCESGWNCNSGYVDYWDIEICYSCPAPTRPNGVTATDADHCDRVHVTWNAVSGADYYTVYRASTQIGGNITGTSYDDYAGAPGTGYIYYVKAHNSCGDSDYSVGDYGLRASAPSVPSGLSATNGAHCDRVRITWISASGADYYKLYREGSRIGGSISGTSYDDTSASSGNTYSYKVRAHNSCGDSGYSNSNTGYRKTAPSTPSGLSATNGTYCDNVRVTWNSVSGTSYYKVYRNGGRIGGDISGTSYNDSSATPGTTYSYTVKAHNDCGDSGASSPDSGTKMNCDDQNLCTDDVCSGGNCTYSNNSKSCDDGDPCTINDTCSGGNCSGTPKDCDDGNTCTDDACVNGVCQHTWNNDLCPCESDSDCDDGNPCTDNLCSGGACQNPNNSNPCDDDDPCTVNDMCSGGACSGTPMDCDDGEPCTDDACVNGVCQHTWNDDICPCNNDSDCDDGNPCTTGSCVNDTCEYAQVPDCPGGCDNGTCDANENCRNCPQDCGCPAGQGCVNGQCQELPDCGKDGCGSDETQCNCPQDCGAPPSSETNCVDGLDNDCDGNTDCLDSDCFGDSACEDVVRYSWYQDADGDGYGNPDVSTESPEQPAGYVLDNTDCDDTDADVHPGASEVCDGADNDCDGIVDPYPPCCSFELCGICLVPAGLSILGICGMKLRMRRIRYKQAGAKPS